MKERNTGSFEDCNIGKQAAQIGCLPPAYSGGNHVQSGACVRTHTYTNANLMVNLPPKCESRRVVPKGHKKPKNPSPKNMFLLFSG